MREAYQALQRQEKRHGWTRAMSAFESRLHWHCHFIQKFEMECRMEFEDINRGYAAQPRGQDDDLVTAWKEGMTGYPLIDATMRALKATGYANFRSRAMLVSFLTHHLWQGLANRGHPLGLAISRLRAGYSLPTNANAGRRYRNKYHPYLQPN